MQIEILLAHCPSFSLKKYNDILRVFGSTKNFWDSGDIKLLGWTPKFIEVFSNWQKKLDEDKLNKILVQEDIRVIIFNDLEYPVELSKVFDPPFALFVRGNLKNNLPNLAVVGTRKYTQYGRQVVHRIIPEIAHEMTIVSGLAFGIDKEVHTATLQINGHTIAVLGGGIDNKTIYPQSHVGLAKNILECGGALVSEYPPLTKPTKFSFPKRNRIVAGMSLGTLVIEAPIKSGSLITAQYALDSAREVFAIPQNITSITAEGPNYLIKNGAHPVTSPRDIFEILQITKKEKIEKEKPKAESPEEGQIINCLTEEPKHLDIIIRETELPNSTVSSTLIMMEIRGVVQNLGNMNYVLR
ncbi:MAG: DNA-processing protein DprA [Candidatus Magasanikbacteria bacterium]|nr:DNA-processing protein DprA [Candidatus Magasanikbacteria bacterium]